MLTALAVLAFTLPPSIAAAWAFWLQRDRAKSIELTKSREEVLQHIGDRVVQLTTTVQEHQQQLKQLKEYISVLSERRIE